MSAPAVAASTASPDPGNAAFTLQFNLCAGDVSYALLTVPRLARAHPRAARRVAVVDLCRPQTTRIFDSFRRLPEPGFGERIAQIRTVAQQLRSDGWIDEIVWLEPGSPLLAGLARRYLAPGLTETHDYGGCANLAYWAGLDAPVTRFVVHYDADMCLHQAPGFEWAEAALALWQRYPEVVMATPRISPPGFAVDTENDAPSLHEGRPFHRVADGWLNDWFSTRCFLLDRERLAPHLPLMQGRLGWEYKLRRLWDRGYPPGPEMLLFRVLGPRGLRRLNLADERAWLLHPNKKTAAYLELLPRLLESVAAGRVPDVQRGQSEIDVPAWQEFFC
ncbi:MAG TPA: hypothetical protein VNR00_18695 [Opitutus sp.]|nr:hypothetical protein [Opitutus sp.]